MNSSQNNKLLGTLIHPSSSVATPLHTTLVSIFDKKLNINSIYRGNVYWDNPFESQQPLKVCHEVSPFEIAWSSTYAQPVDEWLQEYTPISMINVDAQQLFQNENIVVKVNQPAEHIKIDMTFLDFKFSELLSCLKKEDLTKDQEQVIKILKDGGFDKKCCEDIVKYPYSFKHICSDTLKTQLNDPSLDKLIEIIEYMITTFDKSPDSAYDQAMSII